MSLPEKSLNVLILEDRKEDLDLVLHALRCGGFEPKWRCVCAEQDFVSRLCPEPDIILADYNMPRFTAARALEILRDRGMDIPLIVVTGSISEEAAVECIKLGAAEYLIKDRLTRLGQAVAMALEQKRLRLERSVGEEKLRRNEEQLRLLLENTMDIVYSVGADGRIAYVSPAVARWGFSPDDFVGKNLADCVHPDDAERLIRDFEETLSTGREFPSTFRIVAKDGRIFHMEEYGKAVWKDGRVAQVTGVIRDVTERKLAEDDRKNAETELLRSREQLRALAERVESIREEERTRISRELHDQLGHALTGIKMELSSAANQLGHSNLSGPLSEVALKLSDVDALLDKAVANIRRISSELRPGVLDHLGICPAVEWQSMEFAKKTGISCRTELGEDVYIPPDRATPVFRAFQEAMVNVSRHARATEVTIALHRTGNVARLVVRDNGRGISESEISDPKALGLLGMRERLHAIGGEVTISGEAGKGTTVVIEAPVADR